MNDGISKVTALYIRVSTEAQAEEGYSIGAQLERLEAYCKAKGWSNYVTYKDPGYSGSNLERPEMQRLISDVEEKRVGTVLVFKLDRLSRSQKDTLYLIEDVFLPNDVDFISLNESIDTSTPYGRAMIGILSAFAQLERENIYLRTRMGMLERVKQGYWRGGGGIPYGYDYDKNLGYLVPNEDAATVRKVYELYIKGLGPQKIANMLGLKYEKLVMQILTRRSNLGIVSYKGEEYEGQHEAIIDEQTYNLAMAKLKERSKARACTGHSCHLLTGLVYCGVCGARMRYIKWGKGGYKLWCYSNDKSKPYMVRDENCGNESVWANKIESIVLGDLFKISADLKDGGEKSEKELTNPIDELNSRIEHMTRKLKRLYDIYSDGSDEALMETIEENKKQLSALREELKIEEKYHVSQKQMNMVKARINGIADAWDYLTPQEKQSVIRDCIEKIIIDRDKVEIFYTFKISGRTVNAA